MSNDALPAPTSSFVTAIAWVSIAIAGTGLLISLLQNAMIHLVIPMDEMHAQLARDSDAMPAAMGWMLGHIHWLFIAFTGLSLIALIVSIGLLRRRDWARRGFIGLMVFGVLYQVTGLWLQWWVMSDMGFAGPDAPPQFVQQFETMRNLMIAFGVAMALGFGGLCAWLGWKMTTPAIVAEFRR